MQLPEELKKAVLEIKNGKFYCKTEPSSDQLGIFINIKGFEDKILFEHFYFNTCSRHSIYIDLNTFELHFFTKRDLNGDIDLKFPLGDLKALKEYSNDPSRSISAFQAWRSIPKIASEMNNILDVILGESGKVGFWDMLAAKPDIPNIIPLTTNRKKPIEDNDPDVLAVRELIRLIEERRDQFGQFISLP
jgi:hypothetical protein